MDATKLIKCEGKSGSGINTIKMHNINFVKEIWKPYYWI